MGEKENVVDANKLLENGKLITVRPHTRFVHFLKHTHNYIELIYMYSGTTTHFVNENKIELQEGELLLLSKSAVQEILPADENDVAINFIIMPEFFDKVLNMIGEEDNPLKEFVVESLVNKEENVGYLHFKVSDILPIQNLVENLIWTIKNNTTHKRSINQITMGLLFMQLINNTDRLTVQGGDEDKQLFLKILRYVEENYKSGELADLAEQLNYDIYWLSKKIKQLTGKNYTELVQNKRLNQAAYYLANTAIRVADIGELIGYDNLSYFYRIFKKKYGITPHKYREDNRKNNK